MNHLTHKPHRLANVQLWSVVLILLIGAFLRTWHWEEAPPGMQHDELFKAQEGIALVEHGDFRLFYPSNQGHEGGYVWVLGGAYALFGQNLVMLKAPPMFIGLLTLAMLYRVGHSLFGYRVAVLASGFASVSFWLVFTNRLSLRANLLPLVTLIVIWGLWRVMSTQKRSGYFALLTGVMLGFGIYTYTASVALYAAYGLFLVALALQGRHRWRAHWRQLALITVLGALLTLPMLETRLNDPQGQNRVSTINEPWRQFQEEGNPDFLLKNAQQLAGMPYFTGDPEWRYNIAERPLFSTPIGLLVYVGLGLMIWRARHDAFAVLLLGLLLFGLVPSLLTISAPSFLRSIITAPSIMFFIALAIDSLKRFVPTQVVWGLGIGAIVITGVQDSRAYFGEWVQEDAVFEIYRDDLQQLAKHLDALSSQDDVSLVFASTDDATILDPAMYRYGNDPASVDVMWFDGFANIALSSEPRLLFVSPLSPISPAHQPWLTAEYGTTQLDPILRQDGQIAFDVYRLGDQFDGLSQKLAQINDWAVYVPHSTPTDTLSDWASRADYPINFGDVLTLVGVEMPRQVIPNMDNGVDDGLNLQLYLQPLVNDYAEPLSLFVHFIHPTGDIRAGRDFLGAPPPSWHPEAVFIQDNYVGDYHISLGKFYVTMGLYNTQTNERYPILDDSGQPLADYLVLGEIEAVEVPVYYSDYAQ